MSVEVEQLQQQDGVEWRSLTLGDICTKIQDGTHFSPKVNGGDYWYVTSKNIRPGKVDLSTASRIDKLQHESIYRRCDVQYGDLLLTKDGASTGAAALNPIHEPISLLSSVAFLRVDPDLADSQYLLQQILSNLGQRQIQEAMSGNAITRLTLEKIRKLRFSFAPLAEQRAIAAALADADGLIESLERLIAKKRQIKLGAMQQLLTGKRRLPGFEGEWQAITLGSLGRCIRGVSFDPDTHLHSTASSATVSLLRAQNVQNGDLNLNDVLHVSDCRVSDLQRLQFGDVVVCMANGSKALVGKAAVYEGSAETPLTVGAFMAIFRPDPDAASTRLVPYLLHSYAFRAHIDILLAGSSINNLTPNSVESCSIPLPVDRNEQHAIAAVLLDMDAEITALESRLTKARQIKQGMMQQLLTGKIRLPVAEQEESEIMA